MAMALRAVILRCDVSLRCEVSHVSEAPATNPHTVYRSISTLLLGAAGGLPVVTVLPQLVVAWRPERPFAFDATTRAPTVFASAPPAATRCAKASRRALVSYSVSAAATSSVPYNLALFGRGPIGSSVLGGAAHHQARSDLVVASENTFTRPLNLLRLLSFAFTNPLSICEVAKISGLVPPVDVDPAHVDAVSGLDLSSTGW